ncbi:response regulator [Priestia sp. J2]|uniref:response regulator n=1 Tax=Priestia sp. J2 TaxID=2886505 RepID=UPI001E2C779B|nr:response regulator [Priestia sp. J2]
MGNRILIVDDAAFMRMMIKDILTKNGYEVVAEAADGHQAVELFKEHTPDLVTMDITMPEMDGIAALKEIKNIKSDAKVIMCSAMGQQAMVIDAIQAGAKDFIVKPFQADRVVEAISKAIG